MVQKKIIRPERLHWDNNCYTYSPGVERSGIVWLSGLPAGSYDSQQKMVMYPPDLATQTREAYQKIQTVLEAGGLSLKDVVKMVYYITPQALPSFNQAISVRQELFGVEQSPAVTAIAVEKLLRDDALVELEAVAHSTGKKRPIYPDPKSDWKLPYKPAWEGGDILWFAGIVGRTFDYMGNPFFPEGIVAQAKVIYQRAKVILEAAGLSFKDVVATMDYLLPEALAEYKGVADVRREFFAGDFPAHTGVVIPGLLAPGALAEIDFWAVQSGARRGVDPGWPHYEQLTYAPGCRKGNFLFISAQVGEDPKTGKIVGEGDVVAQSRQALANIQRVVEAAGGSMKDVVRTIDYVVPHGLEHYRQTADVRRELFKSDFPCATGVVVSQLLRPGALLAISAMADFG